MTLLDELAALKDKASELQARRGRLEAQVEAAKKTQADSLTALKERFGVTTIKEAEALLKTRREKLSAAIGKLIESLP